MCDQTRAALPGVGEDGSRFVPLQRPDTGVAVSIGFDFELDVRVVTNMNDSAVVDDSTDQADRDIEFIVLSGEWWRRDGGRVVGRIRAGLARGMVGPGV